MKVCVQYDVIAHASNPGRRDRNLAVILPRQQSREIRIEGPVSGNDAKFKGYGRQPARQVFRAGAELGASGPIDPAERHDIIENIYDLAPLIRSCLSMVSH